MLKNSKHDCQPTYAITASTLGIVLATTTLLNSVDTQSSDRNIPIIPTQPDFTGIVDENKVPVDGSIGLPERNTTQIQLTTEGILSLEMDDGTVVEINLNQVRSATLRNLPQESL